MIDPSILQQMKMNADLPDYGKVSHAEKAALKRAERAERAFRASKGYPPDTFWNRLRQKFKK